MLDRLIQLWERVECFAIVNPMLRRQFRYVEAKLESAYEGRIQSPIVFKQAYDCWRDIDFRLRYGIPVTKKLDQQLDQLRTEGLTDRDLRILIGNRIVRSNGDLRVVRHNEICCLVMGWFGVALGISAFALTAGLIWLSPLSTGWKLAYTTFPASCLLYAMCIGCYSIKPWNVLKKNGYL